MAEAGLHTIGATLRLNRSLVLEDGSVQREDQTAEGMANSITLQFERTGGDGWGVISPRIEIKIEPQRFVVECFSERVGIERAMGWREAVFQRGKFHGNVVDAMHKATRLWVAEDYSKRIRADQDRVEVIE